MRRKKKLLLNASTALLFQLCTVICGFVLPQFMIRAYGSDVNGVVHSIAQFLQMIAFLELGVGAVVQSALYKPLADADEQKISEILSSANQFFRKLAVILLFYVILLMFVYPRLVSEVFSFRYTVLLIGVMCISSFAQYYFGVVNRLLLTADQLGFIQYAAQSITLILNTITCVIFIQAGASIHVVKLTTSVVFLLRPIALYLYVKRHYNIDRYVVYQGEPIKQKWNGIAQHVAAVVLDSTDLMVLTIFASLSIVSVYSVYHLVVYGVKQMFFSFAKGVQSLMGELWAKQELDALETFFAQVEWISHTGATFIFGCTAMLVTSFVQVYTVGVTDADYVQPLFAVLLTMAHGCHCLRLPYNMMILASGHYKQTQANYIIATMLNLTVSVLAVNRWGLIGVAIGTLVAMLYQTIWMACYNARQLLCRSLKHF